MDSGNSEKLIKMMDWYVVRLEGGSEDDAARLLSDEPLMLRPRIAPKPIDEETKEKDVAAIKSENGGKESG